MYQSTIAWMIAGVTDTETVEARRQREQLLALRARAGTADGLAALARRRVRAAVARWTGRTEPAAGDPALDCCTA